MLASAIIYPYQQQHAPFTGIFFLCILANSDLFGFFFVVVVAIVWDLFCIGERTPPHHCNLDQRSESERDTNSGRSANFDFSCCGIWIFIQSTTRRSIQLIANCDVRLNAIIRLLRIAILLPISNGFSGHTRKMKESQDLASQKASYKWEKSVK